jgi:hypothetical protein
VSFELRSDSQGNTPRKGRFRWLAYGALALAAQLIIVTAAVSQIQEANRERDMALAQRAGFELQLADADAEVESIRDLLENADQAVASSQERLDDSAREIRTLERRISELKEVVAKARAAAAPKPPPSEGGGVRSCPGGHICYTITSSGSSSVDVTYTNKSGGTSQAIGAALPWFLDLGSNYTADFLYVSGQQSGSGTLTCTIWDGGSVYAKGTSTGQYSICTASD